MLIEFLRSQPLFADLDRPTLVPLVARAHEEQHVEGEEIFREGDEVDAFYLVLEGQLVVTREVEGGAPQELARLGPGGYFAEMGLLNKARRLATAKVVAPSALLRIERSDLIEFLRAHPETELKLRSEIVRRHGRNASALLALAGQRDPRIRLGMPALATFSDGLRASFVLENLALGGIAVSGVPRNWEPGMAVDFALGLSRDPNILDVQGTISWREGDTVGIALDPETSGDGTEVQNALARFLEKRRE